MHKYLNLPIFDSPACSVLNVLARSRLFKLLHLTSKQEKAGMLPAHKSSRSWS